MRAALPDERLLAHDLGQARRTHPRRQRRMRRDAGRHRQRHRTQVGSGVPTGRHRASVCVPIRAPSSRVPSGGAVMSSRAAHTAEPRSQRIGVPTCPTRPTCASPDRPPCRRRSVRRVRARWSTTADPSSRRCWAASRPACSAAFGPRNDVLLLTASGTGGPRGQRRQLPVARRPGAVREHRRLRRPARRHRRHATASASTKYAVEWGKAADPAVVARAPAGPRGRRHARQRPCW